jgi:hypothetical protein
MIRQQMTCHLSLHQLCKRCSCAYCHCLCCFSSKLNVLSSTLWNSVSIVTDWAVSRKRIGKHVPNNAHPTIEGRPLLGSDPVSTFQRHNNMSSVLCRSVKVIGGGEMERVLWPRPSIAETGREAIRHDIAWPPKWSRYSQLLRETFSDLEGLIELLHSYPSFFSL